VWDLPIVFLVVNNGYGMGTSVEHASAEPEIYKRACAFRMYGERVDGDDLDAVVNVADSLLRTAREQRRPAVLEAMTYRFRGHSVADALASPEPSVERLAWGVHAQGSDAQFARMRPGSAFGEEKLVFDGGLGT
jgi:pyruvate dehydrogenase E1 component alpha subunit